MFSILKLIKIFHYRLTQTLPEATTIQTTRTE